MNIIVLAGGYSSERDVSLVSGSQVAAALRRAGHRAVLLDPYASLEAYRSFDALHEALGQARDDYAIPAHAPDLAALKAAAGDGDNLLGRHVIQACKLAEVVFIALHGAYGENGQLQAALDLYSIRYTGSGFAGCLLSMDKAVAKELMAAHGVPVPRGEELHVDKLAQALHSMRLPVVVKPGSGGSSIGITIVNEKEDIPGAVACAKAYEDSVLVEQYIKGRELTVGVLDGEALPVLEIRPRAGFFDYANKYQAGATEEICPAPIDPALAARLQALALRAHRALRLGSYSRADFIVDSGGNAWCLEVNSLPGMTPASLLPQQAAAAGIGYDQLCERIVGLA